MKKKRKKETLRTVQLNFVNQNYFLPAFIKRVEVLEILVIQKRIMQIERQNFAVNMKSM